MSAIGFTIRQLKNWQTHINDFWELHPSATMMGALKTLYTKDRSVNKNVSSKKMWYVILYIHPESDFYNLGHEDKLTDLSGDLFPTSTKNPQKVHDSLLDCMEYAEKACLSSSHQHLNILKSKLRERAEVYAKNTYTLQNSKVLDDMIKSEKYLLSGIQECEDIIKQSSKEGSIKGDGKLSMMESNDLFS